MNLTAEQLAQLPPPPQLGPVPVITRVADKRLPNGQRWRVYADGVLIGTDDVPDVATLPPVDPSALAAAILAAQNFGDLQARVVAL